MFAILLSGEEGGALGRMEVEELAKAYNCKINKVTDRVITTNCPDEMIKRLAYAKVAIHIEWTGKLNQVSRNQEFFKRDHDGFSIKVWKHECGHSSSEIKKRIADTLVGHPNLMHPKETIGIIATGGLLYIGNIVWEFNPSKFELRHPQRRPSFHPTSLKPKMARLLVNLSGIKPGQTLLDPFCGVGGILLEAGLIGINPTGIELDQRWYTGALRNLEYYKVKGKVINANFFSWDGGRYDAIVTDMPYGRSSRMDGTIREFYEGAIEKFSIHSNKLVVMGPIDMSSMLSRHGWKVKTVYRIRVHKSLNRWIHIASMI